MLPLALTTLVVGQLTATPPSPPVDPNQTPIVLVVALGGRTDQRLPRFIQELGLVLDGFELRTIKTRGREFARATLPEQVRLIEPKLVDHKALAAVWLAEPMPGWLMVNLAAVQTGQTLVRTIRPNQQGQATEADLALAVRELLGTAWLFAPLDEQGPPAMQELVESIRDQVTSFGRRYRGGVAALALLAGVEVKNAITEQQGADTAIGLNLTLEAELVEDLWAGVGFAVNTRPSRSTPVFENISSWGISPQVSLVYQLLVFDLRGGRLTLGPCASFGFEYESFTFSLANLQNTYGSARMRAAGGLDLRWYFSRRVGVVLSPKVGWASNRGVYRAQSSNELLVATPRSDWGFLLGVHIRPWR